MIRKTTHHQFDAMALENDKLEVKTLPQLGFKIASIRDKEKDFEFLFQPAKKSYEKAEYAGDFSKYDTSGLDDAAPSIDPCPYPFDKDNIMVDHGDVWSLEWDVKEEGNALVGSVKLPSLPLQLTRKVELDDNEVILSYEMKNLADEEVYYLWTLHGLNYFNDQTELVFPEELKNYINVQNDEEWDFDIHKLGEYPKDHTFKYYFTDKIEKGETTLLYPDVNRSYTICFDPNKTPYLGVWVTTGGFKGECNVAMEPCDGFYDTLERAYNNKKVTSVAPNGTNSWEIRIRIEPIK